MMSSARPMTGIIEGIVTAAGLSKRMGCPKLTLEIDGVPLLVRVVEAALDSHLDCVTVVVGPSQETPEGLDSGERGLRLRVVRNPHPELGMSSSIRRGLAEVSTSASGAMIILADQPWLTPRVIDSLIDSFREHGDKIVAPTVRGRRTNPVVFPRRYFGELGEVTGDTGGRSVLNRHVPSVVLIEMGSFYDDTDLDTPEDLALARETIRRGERRDR